MTGIRTTIEERAGGGVARVVVNNEHKLNVLNSALMEQFVAAFEALAGNDKLRAVVLTGQGARAFIGGVDIAEMATLDSTTAPTLITRVHRCCDAVRRVAVPVIARIEGYALGGGLEIAASCDLRVAAETAKFGMPEVKIGIPSVVEAALLPMLVGWGRARQILYFGDTFSAADAERWGLVERVVPANALDDAVEEWLDAIFANGPLAVRAQKRLMQAWEDLPLRDAVRAGIDTFVASWQTDEPRNAMAKFLASRRSLPRVRQAPQRRRGP